MTDSTDELMKSYEVIKSVVMRHSQYDAARILTLNLATSITADSRQDETAALARLADSIRTLCNAATDMMREDPDGVRELLKGRGPNGERRSVNEFVPFAYTPTRSGGRRQWLMCLKCRRRCRRIFGGRHFRCRQCHG